MVRSNGDGLPLLSASSSPVFPLVHRILDLKILFVFRCSLLCTVFDLPCRYFRCVLIAGYSCRRLRRVGILFLRGESPYLRPACARHESMSKVTICHTLYCASLTALFRTGGPLSPLIRSKGIRQACAFIVSEIFLRCESERRCASKVCEFVRQLDIVVVRQLSFLHLQ